MIKLFEEFINERKQVGNLYHYTSMSGLEGILDEDRMKSFNYPFISFTRDKNWNGFDYKIRITLDGTLLSDKYKIQPYCDPRARRYDAECEEIITIDEILNIRKYIKLIEIEKYKINAYTSKFFKYWVTFNKLTDKIIKKYPEINIKVVKSLKNTKLFEEYISEPITVYHGSDRDFDTFDLEKIGSGDGKGIGGWGIYFSDSEGVASRYYLKSGFVKEYRLRRGNYFDFDDVLDEGFGDQLIEKLSDDYFLDSDIEEFKTDFIDYIPDVTNRQVYEWLTHVTGSKKDASLFLKDLGFYGNKFSDKVDPESTNYVIYDLNCIIYL